MRRLFLRPAHGTVKSLKRPSPDRPSSVRRGAGRHPAGNHAARRMLTPPARAVPLLPFKRVPASWAEQTNAPGVHTPAPGNKRRPSTDAVPRKNISLIPRNPCRKKRAELQSLRTENDALFQARILFEDKFTARRRCVPQEQAVPSPASSRKPPRRTWSGRMRPVPRLHTHMLRDAVPSGIRTQLREKPAPRCPKAGRHRCPSACRPKKQHACPMLCLPPSRRLRAPAALLLLRAALRKRRARPPNLSFQRRTNDACHNSRLSRAQKTPCCCFPLRKFLFTRRGRSPSRSQSPGKALPFVLTLP